RVSSAATGIVGLTCPANGGTTKRKRAIGSDHAAYGGGPLVEQVPVLRGHLVEHLQRVGGAHRAECALAGGHLDVLDDVVRAGMGVEPREGARLDQRRVLDEQR